MVTPPETTESDGVSSAVPADLEEFVDEVDGMRSSFVEALETGETVWNQAVLNSDFVDFASPFEDAENMMTTWENRTEFVSDVRQAFIDADGYDPDSPDVVITVPTTAVTASVGQSAEALEELGIPPEDAEKIADGSPELYDAVINGRIDVDAALRVAELQPTEQRNVLSTDLDSDEIIKVLDGDHGDDAKEALVEGHSYRVRLLMLDEEARAAIHTGDALTVVLDGDENISFEELNDRVQGGRDEIVAAYIKAGLSPEEAQAAYDDLVNSLDYLGENDEAREALDGAADDDSKPGEPDADNKFGIADVHHRAMVLLGEADDPNSQQLLEALVGTPENPTRPPDYDVQYNLFGPTAELNGGTLFEEITDDPNLYFPFNVEVDSCTGAACDTPISVGNVLSLNEESSSDLAQHNPRLKAGQVEVVAVTEDSFTFRAADGHIAEGGLVRFTIWSEDYYDPAVSDGTFLKVEAWTEGGLEGAAPEPVLWFAGKTTWSRMAAAMNQRWASEQN